MMTTMASTIITTHVNDCRVEVMSQNRNGIGRNKEMRDGTQYRQKIGWMEGQEADTGSCCQLITRDMEMTHQYILTDKLMPTIKIH